MLRAKQNAKWNVQSASPDIWLYNIGPRFSCTIGFRSCDSKPTIRIAQWWWRRCVCTLRFHDEKNEHANNKEQ